MTKWICGDCNKDLLTIRLDANSVTVYDCFHCGGPSHQLVDEDGSTFYDIEDER